MVKVALKGTAELEQFNKVIQKAQGLTERKRYYISNYGYKNFIDVVNGTSETLIPDPENYDKHHLENIIEWWKNKATNRFISLKNENRVRTEIEVWTSGKEIDIIR
jgi:AAA+ ATPase superfamily predicted ATPase